MKKLKAYWYLLYINYFRAINENAPDSILKEVIDKLYWIDKK